MEKFLTCANLDIALIRLIGKTSRIALHIGSIVLATAALNSPLSAQSDSTDAQPAAGEESLTLSDEDFFAPYNALTARDMLERVPATARTALGTAE